jgi:lambda repressor-like predicted transcriptional regulator
MRSLIEDESFKKPQEVEIPADGISLDLLRAVYRNSSLALTTRIRAAIAALPHEVPKLAVTAMVSEQDFATVLDRRLKRIEEMKASAIEATPVIDGEKVDARLQPRLPDRRFRRI